MTFRPATNGDFEPVSALWQSCGLTRPWNPPASDISMAVRAPHADLLIAEDNGKIVATIMVGEDGHRAWVYYVAVAPDRRGQGLGRDAMAAAERWAKSRGLPKLQLMVRSTNAQALGFYAALGYIDQSTTVLGKWLDPRRGELAQAAQPT